MPSRNIVLGRIIGIPIDVHQSWFFVFAFISWMLATGYYQQVYPYWATWLKWFMAAITALSLFVSVLLHELGHSAVALMYKIKVNGITLFLFGGVARMDSEPTKPSQEFLIAIAGPLVSLLLAVLSYVAYPLVSKIDTLAALAYYLIIINAALFLFNLIPGYPLDGGRAFRALVWKITGNFIKATVISSIAGRLFSVLLLIYGAWKVINESVANGLWLIFIGWFLYSYSTAFYTQSKLQLKQSEEQSN